DIDNVWSIENGSGAGFVNRLPYRLQLRLQDLRQGRAGEISAAQPQDARGQGKEFPIELSVAKLLQGQQATPCRRAVQTGGAVNVSDAGLGLLRAKGLDYRQATCQAPQRVSPVQRRCFCWCSH